MFLDKMDIEGVKAIARKSLGLDDNVQISDDATLGDFGASREDAADVSFKVGIWNTEHISDGRLNSEGVSFIRMIASENFEYRTHLKSLLSGDPQKFGIGLTFNEMTLIESYDGVAV